MGGGGGGGVGGGGEEFKKEDGEIDKTGKTELGKTDR